MELAFLSVWWHGYCLNYILWHISLGKYKSLRKHIGCWNKVDKLLAQDWKLGITHGGFMFLSRNCAAASGLDENFAHLSTMCMW